MKKILASLLVLALCAPAMAATVGIVNNADGTATITVAAEGVDNIVGLGLNIDVTGGNATAATVDTATFNIFPDAAHDLEVALAGSYGYGDGTPTANQDAVGELDISGGSQHFAISVGALNGIATAGATGSASVQITVMVDADSNICVSENALRGGIVLTTGVGEDITNGTAGVVCEDVTIGGTPECVKDTAPFHADWVAWGMPDCWCFQKQCNGDINGSSFIGKPVTTADLNTFKLAFNVTDAVLAGVANGICADLNHAAFIGKRVTTVDLNTFKTYFNIAEASVPVCSATNYNFWTN